jgi:hypothetical protein
MWNSEEGLPWIATSLYDSYNIQLLVETLLNRRLQHDTSTQRFSLLLCFTYRSCQNVECLVFMVYEYGPLAKWKPSENRSTRREPPTMCLLKVNP